MLRQKRTLKDTEAGKKVFIGEDFSKRTRETRCKLVPFLKEAKKDKNKKMTLVYDHLITDGKKVLFDSDNNCFKDSK